MDIVITQISTTECLPIRQKVLWPDRNLEHSMVPEDDQGIHFGAYAEDKLTCVASVFVTNSEARLRKFAILPAYQLRGIGTQILTHIIERMINRNVSKLWCDAREPAIDFYARFGFDKEGDLFFKNGVPYVKMVVDLQHLLK